MKTRKILSRVVILAGIGFVIYAGVLFIQNQYIENNAATYSADVVEKLLEEVDIEESDIEESDDTEISISKTISIDDNLYIGVLEIPSLNLELPIQSEWSYTKLKNTPCVYQEDPLIIAAHNYDSHFGRISSLKVGDQVIFTDVNGSVQYYEVMVVDIMHETQVDEMSETEYDLTLFTCNYKDNTERVYVRLQAL